MLAAAGGTAFGDAAIQSKLIFGRRFWAHVVTRSGLSFDSRFVPAPTRRSPDVIVYLVLRGNIAAAHPWQMRLEGPASFLLDADGYENLTRAAGLVFRSTGDPYVALEVRLDARDLALSQERPSPIALEPSVWSAAERLAFDAGIDSAAMRSATAELLGELARHGVIRAGVASDEPIDEPAPRIWTSLGSVIARYHVLPTLQELAEETGLSLRQISREMKAFLDVFRFVDTSWRDATRRSRLKLAILGLSARDVSIGAVATSTGYGSSEAMARAFRDAKLPSPNAIRHTLQGEAPASEPSTTKTRGTTKSGRAKRKRARGEA